MPAQSILFVITSEDKLINNKGATGYYLPEAAHPYYVLSPHFNITVASPKGGKVPLDPGSAKAFAEDPDCAKFLKDSEVESKFGNSVKLSEIKVDDFVAIFYVGGHGPVIDLAVDEVSIKLIQDFTAANKLVSAVCHAPAVFANAKAADGSPFIKGKKFTGFSNSEEEAVQAVDSIPFLLETVLVQQGGIYSKAPEDWGVKVVQDGKFFTGQNPASAGPLAEAIKTALLA